MIVFVELKRPATPVCVVIEKIRAQRCKAEVAKMVIQNADRLSNEQTEAICKMMR